MERRKPPFLRGPGKGRAEVRADFSSYHKFLSIRRLMFLNYWCRRMASSGMLRRVALVRADVSEELSASIIRVTRIDELGTTLAVTSKTLKTEAKRWWTVQHYNLEDQASQIGSFVLHLWTNLLRAWSNVARAFTTVERMSARYNGINGNIKTVRDIAAWTIIT
jgi:hypothetical protein